MKGIACGVTILLCNPGKHVCNLVILTCQIGVDVLLSGVNELEENVFVGVRNRD